MYDDILNTVNININVGKMLTMTKFSQEWKSLSIAHIYSKLDFKTICYL